MRIHIKNIKTDMIFWEKSMGFTAIEDAYLIGYHEGKEQWRVHGKSNDVPYGIVEFMETDGLLHYGPKLSTTNDYGYINIVK
jgi:hypothetical protein